MAEPPCGRGCLTSKIGGSLKVLQPVCFGGRLSVRLGNKNRNSHLSFVEISDGSRGNPNGKGGQVHRQAQQIFLQRDFEGLWQSYFVEPFCSNASTDVHGTCRSGFDCKEYGHWSLFQDWARD